MRPIITNNTIDGILNTYRLELGKNYKPYRNHVYRVYNFSLSQLNSKEDLEKLSIPTAFHDLSTWTNKTFTYLSPAAQLAREYCRKQNISFSDTNEIEIMINSHYRQNRVKSSVLADIFREANLIDLTLGIVQKGRKKKDIRFIRDLFPNKGFHLFLINLLIKNLIPNPSRSLPIFKL